jgi:hypothetical protein
MFRKQVMNKLLCQSGYLNIVGKVSLPITEDKVLVLQILYPLQRTHNDLILRTLHHAGITITPTTEQMP